MSSNISILVIDDEINMRRSMDLILKRDGYNVTTAATGQEGLKYIENAYFDLVFLDLKMLDISGLDLLPKIRQINPDLPVLIFTAHATLDSAIEALRKGARDYLLKPINPPQILSRVREIIAEQQHSKRREEIVSQVQNLITELRMMDESKSTASDHPVSIHHQGQGPDISTDPGRYLTRGPLTLDLHTHSVIQERRHIPFPPTTFDYLLVLARYSPDTVPYNTLVKEAQGYDLPRLEARDISRWHIHEIRKQLEEDPRHPLYIITVRDFGYRLVV